MVKMNLQLLKSQQIFNANKILIYFSEVCGVWEYSEPFCSTEFTNSRIIDPVKEINSEIKSLHQLMH